MTSPADRLKDAPAAGLGKKSGPAQGSARRKAPGREYLLVPPERIKPNPHQPRKTFDPAAILALARSIENVGLLEPLVVQPGVEPGTVQLIAGERRLRACQRAGLKLIPCMMREAGTDRELAELAIIENALREDLSPMEEAEALAQMKAQGYSLEKLSQITGKAKSTLSEIISLAGLSPVIKERLKDEKKDLPRRTLVEVAKIEKKEGHGAAVEAFESARAGAKRGDLKPKPSPAKAKPQMPPTAELQAARAVDQARGLAELLKSIKPEKISPSMAAALRAGLGDMGRQMEKLTLALKRE